MPERWGEHVRRWRELTGGLEDSNEEYLVWQTLVVPVRSCRPGSSSISKGSPRRKANVQLGRPERRTTNARVDVVRSLTRTVAFLDDSSLRPPT